MFGNSFAAAKFWTNGDNMQTGYGCRGNVPKSAQQPRRLCCPYNYTYVQHIFVDMSGGNKLRSAKVFSGSEPCNPS